MKHVLLAAVVALALLVPSATSAEPATTPRLLFSHFTCDVSTNTGELHFILHDIPNWPIEGTWVEWAATLDGVPINGTAPFAGITGSVAHYVTTVTLTPGAHEFVILAETYVDLPDTPRVYLSNPQTVSVTCEVPTAVMLASLASTASGTSACRMTGKKGLLTCVCPFGRRWIGAPKWMCR